MRRPDKMSGRRLVYLALAAAALVAVAFAVYAARNDSGGTDTNPPDRASHGGPVKDYVSLIDNLRGQGAAVDPKGDASQTFFATSGYMIGVNGRDVQVFEYPDAAAAQTDADKVSPDGSSVGTSMVTWVDKPHFYKKDRIIVLYVGSDTATLDLLAKLLGPQFAGR